MSYHQEASRCVAFLLLCFALATEGATTCSLDQWCWRPQWGNEYLFSSQLPVGYSAAASLCAAQNASLPFPSDEVQQVFDGISAPTSVWASNLDPFSPVVVKRVRDYLARADSTGWDGCWNSSTSSCCFYLSNITTMALYGEDCGRNSVRSVVCQRSGKPLSWVRATNGSTEFEYGYFSRLANFTEAAASCGAEGGSLAFTPSPIRSMLNTTTFNITNNSTLLWVGFTAGTWTSTSASQNGAQPSDSFNTTQCAAVRTAGWNISGVNCTSRLGFLCQRLAINATPAASQRCAVNGSVYEYIGMQGSGVRGATPDEAMRICRDNGGVVTKFSNPAALILCFGSTTSLAFVASVYGSGIWQDSTTNVAIPSFLSNLGGVPCAYVNASTTTLRAGGMPCTTRLITFCEYSGVASIVVPPRVYVSSGCTVRLRPMLSQPLAGAVKYCLLTGQCLDFAATSLVASNFYNISTTSAPTVSISPCNNPLYCTTGFTNVTIVASSTTVVLTVGGSDLSLSSGSTLSLVAYYGKSLKLPRIQAGPLSGSAINLTVQLRIRLTSGTAACTLATSSFILTNQTANVSPEVYCTQGSNASTVDVLLSSYSNDWSSCVVADYFDVRVASVKVYMSYVVFGASTPLLGYYEAFGAQPSVSISLPAALERLDGVPQWVCVSPGSVAPSTVALSTIGGAACFSSELRSPTINLTFLLNGVTEMNLTISLVLGGSEPGVISKTLSTLTVFLALRLTPVTLVDPLCDVGALIVGVPVSLYGTIPSPLPNGSSLLLTFEVNDTASNRYTLTFNGSRTQIFLLNYSTPKLTGDPNYVQPVALGGTMQNYFYISNRSACPFYRFPSAGLALGQIPVYLFVGKPYALMVSIPPSNPLRGASVNISLSCGVSCFGCSVLPGLLQFNALQPAIQYFSINCTSIASGIGMFWVMTNTSSQYVIPPNFTVAVRSAIPAYAKIFPIHQYYFDRVNYTLVVNISSPSPQSNVTIAVSNQTFSAIPVKSGVFSSSDSSLVATVQFQINSTAIATDSITNVTVPLAVSGPDASAVTLQTPVVLIQPVLRRISVQLTSVPYFLVGGNKAVDIQVTLSRPLFLSKNLTIQFVPTNLKTVVVPSSLVWSLGDSDTKTITMQTCTSALGCTRDLQASVLVRPFASDEKGADTQEVSEFVRWCTVESVCDVTNASGFIPMPCITRSKMSASATTIELRLNETQIVTVSLEYAPLRGLLNLTLTSAVYLKYEPRYLVFTNSTPSSLNLTVWATEPKSGFSGETVSSAYLSDQYTGSFEICYFIDRTLDITATPQNLAYTSASAFTIVAAPAIPITLFINIGSPNPFSCISTATQLDRQRPSLNNVLVLQLDVLSLGYKSTSLDISPATFQWSAGSSSPSFNAVLLPKTGGGVSTEIVTLLGSIKGNASSYSGFAANITLIPTTNISLTFPARGATFFPRERAEVLVNLTRLPLLLDSVVAASIRVTNTTCTSPPTLGNFSDYLTSTNTTTVMRLSLSSPNDESCNATVAVLLQGSGIASGEYAIPASLVGEVVFVRRRRIWASAPNYTFDGQSFAVNVTIEELPDAGEIFTLLLLSTISLVWTNSSTSLTQSATLQLRAVNEENTTLTVPFDVSPTVSAMEKNRYGSPPNVTFLTLPLLQLKPIGELARTFQVLGELNNQTVRFVLSRPPLTFSDVTAVVSYTSPIQNLITLSPNRFSWSWSDKDNLSRSFVIIGNVAGIATNFNFTFSSSYPSELGDANANVITPGSMTILNRYTLSYSCNKSVMYVGRVNGQFLNLSITMPPFVNLSVPLTVYFSFSAPSIVMFSERLSDTSVLNQTNATQPTAAPQPLSNVTFAVGSTRRWVAVWIEGLGPGSGIVIVTSSNSSEFSDVIIGFEGIQVLPLIRFDVAFNGVSLRNVSTTPVVALQSDTLHAFSWQMSNYGVDVATSISVVGAAPPQQAIVNLSRSVFAFDSLSALSQSFFFFALSRVKTNVTLVLQWNSSQPSIFERPYNVSVVLLPDWELLSYGAPSEVFEGPKNVKIFSVNLWDPVTQSTANSTLLQTAPQGEIAVVMTTTNCDRWVRVAPMRTLVWTVALFTPVNISVNGTFPTGDVASSRCSVAFARLSPNYDFVVGLVGRDVATALYGYPSITIDVSRAPILNGTEYGNSKVISCRSLQKDGYSYVTTLFYGSFNQRALVPSPPVVAEDSDTLQLLLATNPIVITTSTNLATEPQGLLSQKDVSLPLFNVTFLTTSNISLRINAQPNIILIGSTVVVAHFSNLAFEPGAFPNEDLSSFINFTVTKYVADIVTNNDRKNVGILSALALVGALFAGPSVATELFKANLLLLLLACPDDSGLNVVFPFNAIQPGGDPSLMVWMTAALGCASLIAGLFLAHLCVVIVVKLFVNVEKKFRGKVEKFADSEDVDKDNTHHHADRFTVVAALLHYPTAPVVLLFALSPPTAWYAATVLINASTPIVRVVALFILVGLGLVFPIFMHGVVWRSLSLEFIRYAKFHWLLGPVGFWWHPTNKTYLPRYWVMLMETRENTRWFVLWQYIANFAVCVVIGSQPVTLRGCTAETSVVTSIIVIQWVALVMLRPFRVLVLNILYIALYSVQVAATVTLSYLANIAIRSDTIQFAVVKLLIFNAALVLVLSLVALFSKCFTKTANKMQAVIEFHARKKVTGTNRLEADDLQQDVQMVMEGDDGGMYDDDEEELAPHHPLYSSDTFGAPPAGAFRSEHRGYISGAESAFSPTRKREIENRLRLHDEYLKASTTLTDGEYTFAAAPDPAATTTLGEGSPTREKNRFTRPVGGAGRDVPVFQYVSGDRIYHLDSSDDSEDGDDVAMNESNRSVASSRYSPLSTPSTIPQPAVRKSRLSVVEGLL